MIFHHTNLLFGPKLYHSQCFDRYHHNCLQSTSQNCSSIHIAHGLEDILYGAQSHITSEHGNNLIKKNYLSNGRNVGNGGDMEKYEACNLLSNTFSYLMLYIPLTQTRIVDAIHHPPAETNEILKYLISGGKKQEQLRRS